MKISYDKKIKTIFLDGENVQQVYTDNSCAYFMDNESLKDFYDEGYNICLQNIILYKPKTLKQKLKEIWKIIKC